MYIYANIALASYFVALRAVYVYIFEVAMVVLWYSGNNWCCVVVLLLFVLQYNLYISCKLINAENR